MAIITLTTDFGERDGYVGAMKGVIARRAPATTRLIDIAHDIPPGDIAHAAWVVMTACPEFPAETIHVVVVDPGVGGSRRGVIARQGTHLYVGPDNGVFGHLKLPSAFALDNRGAFAKRISPTFHGRDVFAYAAAALAHGREPAKFGPLVALEAKLPWGVRRAGEGRVVHVDRFGNLVTDLPPSEAGAAVAVAGQRVALHRIYEDVAPGQLLAYVGSMGTIEIAVRDGRADRALDAPRGTRVVPVADGDVYR